MTIAIDINCSHCHVTSVGDVVFLGCKNLNRIAVEKQNPRFSDIDGIL
jgi:hypothetical protein